MVAQHPGESTDAPHVAGLNPGANGGGRGIRTPGGLAAPAVFKLGRPMFALGC